MDNFSISRESYNKYMSAAVQQSFIKYMILYVIVGVVAWLGLHYGTNWFKNASDDTVRVWEQAGVAASIATAVCAIAFFTRML